MRRKTKTELTMDVLKAHGRITEAMGHAVHGRYHVAGAIFRLRNGDSDLVPTGHAITTSDKYDVNGNLYAEWQLKKVA